MIGPRAGTRVWLAAAITDMRCGIDSLAVKVQATLAKDPYAGHVFAFCGGRGDLVKLLWSDRDGCRRPQCSHSDEGKGFGIRYPSIGCRSEGGRCSSGGVTGPEARFAGRVGALGCVANAFFIGLPPWPVPTDRGEA